jgi:hypothetical protein
MSVEHSQVLGAAKGRLARVAWSTWQTAPQHTRTHREAHSNKPSKSVGKPERQLHASTTAASLSDAWLLLLCHGNETVRGDDSLGVVFIGKHATGSCAKALSEAVGAPAGYHRHDGYCLERLQSKAVLCTG